jgi:hypothetical protein
MGDCDGDQEVDSGRMNGGAREILGGGHGGGLV